MWSLPGIIGCLLFIYVRPHEFFRGWRDYNPLNFFVVLAVLGMAIDLGYGRARWMSTPLLRYVLAFAVWCVVTRTLRGFDGLSFIGVAVCLVVYFTIAHGVQRLSSLKTIAAVVFSLGLFVAYVGLDQGLSPFQCAAFNPYESSPRMYPDGRECEIVDADGLPHDGRLDCIATGKPGVGYQCERAGLFDTTSIGGGRVRYLGVLMDPNDLALATAMVVPFAFAWVAMRATVGRAALLLASLGIVGGEIAFTQSRGGQLTLGAVLGAYFVKKYGLRRGAILGAVMAIPVLLVGGRSDEGAQESTMERLGCACAGIKMLMSYPFTGVGFSRYCEYHGQTAHNAYILAAGELGLPGMWLFGWIVYLSLKIPATILRLELSGGEDERVLRSLAMAVLAALAGGSVGIFFLSWTYHYVLWIHFGLSGALYTVTKRAYPSYECRLTWREAAAIAAGYVALLVVWSVYIWRKGAWQ